MKSLTSVIHLGMRAVDENYIKKNRLNPWHGDCNNTLDTVLSVFHKLWIFKTPLSY